MAAIDFPSAPSNGQQFTAPSNGVTYIYDSTLTAWKTLTVTGVTVGVVPPSSPAAGQFWWNSESGQLYFYYLDPGGAPPQWVPASPTVPNMPVQVGGDFTAVLVANTGAQATLTPMPFPNVICGNAGSWYNTSNGRYTPPAGRYLLTANVNGIGPATQQLSGSLRKNGVDITNAWATNGVANTNVFIALSAEVNANGSDYFELAIAGVNGAITVISGSSFTAVPVGVTQMLPPPGTLYLHSEHVLSAPGTELIVNWPNNAKKIEIEWDSNNVAGGTNVGWGATHLINGVNVSGNGYYTLGQGAIQLPSVAAAPFATSAAANYNLGTGSANHGKVSFFNEGAQMRGVATWGYYSASASGMVVYVGDLIGTGTGINGFRIYVGASTMPAGAWMRCYVVT